MVRFVRVCFFFFGCVIFGYGLAVAVKVKYLGLHPWEVLNVALYEKFGLTIGTWSIVISAILLIFSYFFGGREYISLGTFVNVMLVGPSMDIFLWLDVLPQATNTWVDYLILFMGIVIAGTGGGLYVAAGLGAGPRDGFMLAISNKTGLSVSRARIVVESLVIILGLLLGGPVFIVTFIYTFIQSPVFSKANELGRKFIASLEKKRQQGEPTVSS